MIKSIKTLLPQSGRLEQVGLSVLQTPAKITTRLLHARWDIALLWLTQYHEIEV